MEGWEGPQDRQSTRPDHPSEPHIPGGRGDAIGKHRGAAKRGAKIRGELACTPYLTDRDCAEPRPEADAQ
jgi:hypothetical protein